MTTNAHIRFTADNVGNAAYLVGKINASLGWDARQHGATVSISVPPHTLTVPEVVKRLRRFQRKLGGAS